MIQYFTNLFIDCLNSCLVFDYLLYLLFGSLVLSVVTAVSSYLVRGKY